MAKKEQKKWDPDPNLIKRVQLTITARFDWTLPEFLDHIEDINEIKDKIREQGEVLSEELIALPYRDDRKGKRKR